jgi:hypothetical protein
MSNPSVASSIGSRRVAFYVALFLGVFLATRYTGEISTRVAIRQYFSGVYASRIVGRESVIAFSNMANALDTALFHHHTNSLLVGWIITNCGSFFVAAALLYRATVHRHPRLLTAYLATLVFMALAGTVVTPYDYLSYALIMAVVTGALRRSWWSMPMMALAMSTRESSLLALAIIAAMVGSTSVKERYVSQLMARLARDRRRIAVLIELGAVAFTVYVTLKLATSPRHHVRLVEHVMVTSHVSKSDLVGIALAALMIVVSRTVLTFTCDTRGRTVRVRLLWILAAPYLFVCSIWGLWSEAPRLIVPLLIGEVLITAALVPTGDSRIVDVRHHTRGLRPE